MKHRLLILMLFLVAITKAQTPVLDPTFGNNGISLGPVTTQYPFRILFEDNKYFLILTSNGGVVSKNYDGSLNTSFGTNGRKYFNAASETITVSGTKFDNGYIYIFGKISGGTNATDNGFIVKMSTTGTLDSSFGGTGKAIFDFGASESINDIQFTNSGIFAVGTKSGVGMFLAKITSAGNLDTSFDAVGYKTYDQNSMGLGVYSLGTDLLICGTTYSNSTGYITAWKVDQNGNLVTGYGTNGKKEVVYQSPTNTVSYYFKSSKLDPNGNLLINYDYVYSFIDRGSRLVKFNLSTNSLESFADFYHNLYLDYYVDNNSKVYTTESSDCGSSRGQCNRIFSLKKTNYDATADLSFNNTGFFSYKISPVQSYGEDLSTCFYFHDDGKIVMAGYGVAINYGLEMLRLTMTPLGTEEFNTKKFSLYPSPVENVININTEDNITVLGITVFDIYGKCIYENKVDTRSIGIENLDSGVYFLKIKTSDSETVLKFIKK